MNSSAPKLSPARQLVTNCHQLIVSAFRPNQSVTYRYRLKISPNQCNLFLLP